MTFPVVIGTNGAIIVGNSIPVVHPPGVMVGDLLVVTGWGETNAEIVDSALGWNVIGPTPMADYTGATISAPRHIVFWKIATGNDSLTISVTRERAGFISTLIRGGKSVTGSFRVAGTTESAVSPLHTPPKGAKDYLWISTFAALKDQRPAPSGFTGTYFIDSAIVPGGIAYRSLNASTLTPGSWGATSPYFFSSAFTLAVEPYETATITDISAFNVGSYASTYAIARAGAGLAKSSNLWVGQYKGSVYELSQAFLGINLSSIPANSVIKTATLKYRITEAYGLFSFQVLKHEWPSETIAAWIPGADLTSKPSLGTDAKGETLGLKTVSLTGLQPGVLNKLALVSTDTILGDTNVSDDTCILSNSGITLDIVYEVLPGPTLNLELDRYSVPANAPIGYVAANLIGKTPGSTLSNANTGPELERVGTEFRVKTALNVNDLVYFVGAIETLAGATNSPFEYGTSISVTPAKTSEFIAATTGTGSAITMPVHQAGDLIFAWAYRENSNTLPTLPTGQGWIVVNGVTGKSTNSAYLVYKIATSSSETVGTFANATTMIVSVYRPLFGYTLSVGASAVQTNGTATITYPGLTLQDTSGLSTVVAFSGHRSINTALETPPPGMVLRANSLDSTDEAAAFDTNKGVSSWSAQTITLGGTPAGWRTAVVEIKGTSPNVSTRKQPRRSYWL